MRVINQVKRVHVLLRVDRFHFIQDAAYKFLIANIVGLLSMSVTGRKFVRNSSQGRNQVQLDASIIHNSIRLSVLYIYICTSVLVLNY